MTINWPIHWINSSSLNFLSRSLAIISVLVIVCYPSSAEPSITEPKVFSANSSPFGIPFSEWAIKWWQWHISIPKAEHPRENPESTYCPVGNDGPVSFLTHSIQGISEQVCNIPAGNAILISVSSGECDSDEIKSGEDAALRKCASEGNEHAAFEVTVDGKSVNIHPTNENRTQTRFFNITIPRDNFYEVNPGTYKAIVDGYFALLEPLPKGEHTLRVRASVSNPLDPSFNFANDAIYHLRVQ
jgi:hypothetical protein